MKISRTHQRFANRIGNQRALQNPEEFLGPNWKDVLNFWIYLDILSNEQFGKVSDLYWALERTDRIYSVVLANNASCEVKSKYISHCAFMSAPGWAGGDATRELIGAHKILEQGKPLTFATLLINLNYS
jgi:hypothetical protein